MADYPLHFSGAQVDEAIGIALNLEKSITDSGLVGCVNLTPKSDSDSVNLDTLTTVGVFTADKYSGGPTFSTDNTAGVAPLQISVTKTVTSAGVVDKYYQYVTVNGKMAYRSKGASDSAFGNWIVAAQNQIVTATSVTTDGNGRTTLYRISGDFTVANQLGLVAIIPNKNAAGAKLIIDTTQYSLYTSDGNTLGDDVLTANSYVQLYCSVVTVGSTTTTSFYAIGASGTTALNAAITEIKGQIGTPAASGVLYNSGTSTNPKFDATNMTKNEADAIHALTTNKNFILASSSAGLVVASSLTTTQANAIGSLLDNQLVISQYKTTGDSSTPVVLKNFVATSAVICTNENGAITSKPLSGFICGLSDLKSGTVVTLADIPVPTE